MFAKTTDVGFAQRVVATLVASAVVLASYGVYTTAQAANLVEVSNTLSTSAPGVTASHTIDFNIPTGSDLVGTDTVTITFPAGFVIDGGLAIGDIEATNGDSSATTEAGFNVSGQAVSFTGATAAAGETVRVVIADGEITSPTPVTNSESYEFVITTDASGTAKDSGKTRVVIINTVLVTAIVETTFDFTITGLATSTAVNGTSTTGSTSPTSIPFGVLTAGEIKTLAQQLNVQTNARNGFVVTVESDGELESSTGAIIDGFIDGTDISTAGNTWVTPTNNIALENTWGHWGMTYEDDATLDLASGDFIAVSSTTPREVFSHDGPSDNTTVNIGESIVGYQIEITALQEAGDDYNTTLTYIATPTF